MSEPDSLPLRDGGRLAYSVRGEGPVVLLLRPLGGSMLCWGRFAEHLAERARVICFDPRGIGASSPAQPLTTTRQMAADARELLDHLELDRAHLFGLSLGGMVASWMAIDAPARVDRLILASTLPRGLGVRAGSVLRGLSLARCLANRPADAEACIVSQILSVQFRKAHPDEVVALQGLARQRPSSHLGLLTMLQAAARHDVRARLHEIVAQTLVVTGGHDPLLTVSSQRKLLADIPNASFELIADAGHDLTTEAPERSAQLALQFIGLS